MITVVVNPYAYKCESQLLFQLLFIFLFRCWHPWFLAFHLLMYVKPYHVNFTSSITYKVILT